MGLTFSLQCSTRIIDVNMTKDVHRTNMTDFEADEGFTYSSNVQLKMEWRLKYRYAFGKGQKRCAPIRTIIFAFLIRNDNDLRVRYNTLIMCYMIVCPSRNTNK